MDFMMSVVLIYVFLLVILLASGIWIGIAIGFVGCFALLLLASGGLNQSIGMVVFNGLHSFTMTAVPLFIFMGCILIRCGISERLYDAASLFFKRIPGNLLHSNVLSSAIFASIEISPPAVRTSS